jgi:ADP-ribose pyrophosphatase
MGLSFSNNKDNNNHLPNITKHTKCIEGKYPRSDVERNQENPQFYEAPILNTEPIWADPSDPKLVDFVSRFEKTQMFFNFELNEKGYPINPVGETGINGRGELGKFGPNCAADPIVTRWKIDTEGNIIYDEEGNPILQIVVVTRKDNGEFALPGGMVDPGEHASLTIKREFGEEALNSLEMTTDEIDNIKSHIDNLFDDSICIYEGYVDDPRNTNNAWMVTSVYLSHDETGDALNHIQLKAGDDAASVHLMDYSPLIQQPLYASHSQFIEHAYNILSSI